MAESTETKSVRIAVLSEELDESINAGSSYELDIEIQPKPEVIDPITVIIVGGGALLIGKFVVDLLDRLRGGIVIDLRRNAPNGKNS